jgi:peptidoglycan/LPS O-acetylase OafA/YrhL
MGIACGGAVNWAALAAWRFALASIVFSGHLVTLTGENTWANTVAAFDGKAAVVGFLLVSGFSIAASLDRDQHGFYRRRLLRVYPLYFTAVLLSFLLELWTEGHVKAAHESLVALGWPTALGNLVFLQTFLVKPIQFDGPVWSLSIEVFYYLLAPLLSLLSRDRTIIIIAVSAVCYALPKYSDLGAVYSVLSKFNALNYVWCWLLGFLLWRDRSWVTLAFACVGIPLMMFIPNTPGPLAVGTYIITVALLLFSQRDFLPRGLKSLAEYLGDLSYPLYLFHFPTLILAYCVIGLQAQTMIIVVVGIITMAAYHGIDCFIKRKYIMPLLFPLPFAKGVPV